MRRSATPILLFIPFLETKIPGYKDHFSYVYKSFYVPYNFVKPIVNSYTFNLKIRYYAEVQV